MLLTANCAVVMLPPVALDAASLEHIQGQHETLKYCQSKLATTDSPSEGSLTPMYHVPDSCKAIHCHVLLRTERKHVLPVRVHAAAKS